MNIEEIQEQIDLKNKELSNLHALINKREIKNYFKSKDLYIELRIAFEGEYRSFTYNKENFLDLVKELIK